MASFEVFREFFFEAAHALYDPEAPAGGKYRNLHGHSFRVRVTLRGERKSEEQWVMDLGKLGRRLAALHETHPGLLVSPYVMMQASDARFFTAISDHVYRFTPFRLSAAERQ